MGTLLRLYDLGSLNTSEAPLRGGKILMAAIEKALGRW